MSAGEWAFEALMVLILVVSVIKRHRLHWAIYRAIGGMYGYEEFLKVYIKKGKL